MTLDIETSLIEIFYVVFYLYTLVDLYNRTNKMLFWKFVYLYYFLLCLQHYNSMRSFFEENKMDCKFTCRFFNLRHIKQVIIKLKYLVGLLY